MQTISHPLSQQNNTLRSYLHTVEYSIKYAQSIIYFAIHPPVTPPTINFLEDSESKSRHLVPSGYSLESSSVAPNQVAKIRNVLTKEGFVFSTHKNLSDDSGVYFHIVSGNQPTLLMKARRLLAQHSIDSSIFIAR